ncbi:MAG: 3D domain-containing protein [Phycisphaeraceae bacterium]|nr:MAG: 3D domain-containing protein [Phycisphaeraceae bacterium]
MKDRGHARDEVFGRALGWRRAARGFVGAAGFLAAAGLVAWSAVLAKQATWAPTLAEFEIRTTTGARAPESPRPVQAGAAISPESAVDRPFEAGATDEIEMVEVAPAPGEASAVRWFNGRPIRPSKLLRMRVTAYSPDERSCGPWADGMTATLHSVETNGFNLVAADPRVLKYGSLISVPGYAEGSVVPVLDCGGKIKGSRLDVLYPTHGEARRWGSQWLSVTVWEYADGKPSPKYWEARAGIKTGS